MSRRLAPLIAHAQRIEDEIQARLAAAQRELQSLDEAIAGTYARQQQAGANVSAHLHDQYLRYAAVMTEQRSVHQAEAAQVHERIAQIMRELHQAHQRRRSFEHLQERAQKTAARVARRRAEAAVDELVVSQLGEAG